MPFLDTMSLKFNSIILSTRFFQINQCFYMVIACMDYDEICYYLVQSKLGSVEGSRHVIPAMQGKQNAVDTAANTLHSTKRPTI